MSPTRLLEGAYLPRAAGGPLMLADGAGSVRGWTDSFVQTLLEKKGELRLAVLLAVESHKV